MTLNIRRRVRWAFVLVVTLGAMILPVTLSGSAATAVSTQVQQAAPHGFHFKDRARDTRLGIDIRKMVVWPNWRPKWVFVQIRGKLRAKRLNGAVVYVDTIRPRRNRGPEFRVVAYSRKDKDRVRGNYVARVGGWNAGGTRVRCPRLGVQFYPGKNYVEFDIPRRCLNSQRKVRVNGQTWDFTRYTKNPRRPTRGYNDHVPFKHRFPKRWR